RPKRADRSMGPPTWRGQIRSTVRKVTLEMNWGELGRGVEQRLGVSQEKIASRQQAMKQMFGDLHARFLGEVDDDIATECDVDPAHGAQLVAVHQIHLGKVTHPLDHVSYLVATVRLLAEIGIYPTCVRRSKAILTVNAAICGNDVLTTKIRPDDPHLPIH